MSAAELVALAATDVREPIDQEELLTAMTTSPFVYIPGTFNSRDLGLVPSPEAAQKDDDGTGTGAGNGNKIRPGFAFRSGALDAMTPQAKEQLASELRVRRVFDLRSEGERGDAPDPDVPGVENTWSATEEKEAKAELADFVEGGGEAGYERMYLDVLRIYRGPFRAVLEHVRDRPQEPFLFHCTAPLNLSWHLTTALVNDAATHYQKKQHKQNHRQTAGRDRTGVLAGLLHALAGQDPALAELDYMLSRVGTEPAREMLLAFVMRGTGAASRDEPGFYNLSSLRPASWRAFVDAVGREYGGFDGYARDALGFSREDLDLIRKNLSRDWKP